jgi:hypothetical protein
MQTSSRTILRDLAVTAFVSGMPMPTFFEPNQCDIKSWLRAMTQPEYEDVWRSSIDILRDYAYGDPVTGDLGEIQEQTLRKFCSCVVRSMWTRMGRVDGNSASTNAWRQSRPRSRVINLYRIAHVYMRLFEWRMRRSDDSRRSLEDSVALVETLAGTTTDENGIAIVARIRSMLPA